MIHIASSDKYSNSVTVQYFVQRNFSSRVHSCAVKNVSDLEEGGGEEGGVEAEQ